MGLILGVEGFRVECPAFRIHGLGIRDQGLGLRL
jgi:hypothetical protein